MGGIRPAETAEATTTSGVASITHGSLDSVAELLDFHDGVYGYLSTHTDFQAPPADTQVGLLAFRGQSRQFGTLTPSFQRQFDRKSVRAATIIEQRLIQAFRIHYAELRDRSPEMPYPTQIGETYDLRCLSVMQHYEIPTRLLDWTSSFWTAVYFACASEPTQNAELWYYHRDLFAAQAAAHRDLATLLDSSTTPPAEPAFLNRPGETLLTELDPKITPRMIHQAGHHTVSSDVFTDHASLLLDLARQAEPESTPLVSFGRVLIGGQCKSKVLQFLAEERNITASTIFPDVVGLGRFLRWQFESLRTMMF